MADPTPTPMDPVLHSSLTSAGMVIATTLATWAVSKGFIPPDQQGAFINGLVVVGGAAATAFLWWWKAQRQTQEALIKTVNDTPNGVTVVSTKDAQAAGIPPAEAPIPSPPAPPK